MSPKHKRRPVPQPSPATRSTAGVVPLPAPWEWPLLAALFLSPVLAGTFETAGVDVLAWPMGLGLLEPLGSVPARIWIALVEGLVWVALILRLSLRDARREALPATLVGRLLAGFVLLLGLSLLVSVYRGATLRAFAQAAAWLAAFTLAADLARRPGGAMRLLIALLGGVFLAGTLGLRQTLENGRNGQWNWRVFGTFMHPNLYASCLLSALPIALVLFLRAQGLLAAAVGGMVLVLLSQLMFTGSRAAVYLLPVVLALFAGLAAWRGPLRGRAAWARLALLAVPALVVAFLSTPTLQRRAAGGPAREEVVPVVLCPDQSHAEAEDSTRFRVYTWKGTARMAAARPLLGTGAGTFEYAYPRYALAGFTRHAHQGYLQIAGETGALALLLWLAAGVVALLTPLRRGWDSDHAWWSPAVIAALAASAAHNLVESTWMVAGIGLPFWTLLGLAANSPVLSRSDGPAEELPSSSSSSSSGQTRGVRVRPPGPAGSLTPNTQHLTPVFRPLLLAAAAVFLVLDGLAMRTAALEGEAVASGSPMAARARLEEAAGVSPWNAMVRAARAGALAQGGDLNGAIREYERAAAMAPTHAALHHRLGRVREAAGDLPGAIAAYRAAAAASPQSTQARLALAEALERSGDRSGALAVYEELLRIEAGPAGQVRAIGESLDYRFGAAHQRVGEAARDRGDVVSAREHFLKAACQFAQLRSLLRPRSGRAPVPDMPDPERAAQLRTAEIALWEWLADDFARTGDAEKAAAAREMVERARQDR